MFREGQTDRGKVHDAAAEAEMLERSAQGLAISVEVDGAFVRVQSAANNVPC